MKIYKLSQKALRKNLFEHTSPEDIRLIYNSFLKSAIVIDKYEVIHLDLFYNKPDSHLEICLNESLPKQLSLPHNERRMFSDSEILEYFNIFNQLGIRINHV